MKSTVRNFVSAVLVCGMASVMTTAAWADGAASYAKCKTCHGADGAGNPGMAKALGVTFKPLAPASDDDIKNATTKGVGKMKPVAGIAGADLDELVKYIHGLKKM